MLSPAPERFDRPARSNTLASVHHPTVHAGRKAQPHPNGIPSSRSIPALAGPVSVLRFERVLRPQDASGPKIAALDGQQYVPMCFRLAFASR